MYLHLPSLRPGSISATPTSTSTPPVIEYLQGAAAYSLWNLRRKAAESNRPVVSRTSKACLSISYEIVLVCEVETPVLIVMRSVPLETILRRSMPSHFRTALAGTICLRMRRSASDQSMPTLIPIKEQLHMGALTTSLLSLHGFPPRLPGSIVIRSRLPMITVYEGRPVPVNRVVGDGGDRFS